MSGRRLDRRTLIGAGLAFSATGLRAAAAPAPAHAPAAAKRAPAAAATEKKGLIFNRIDPAGMTPTFEETFKTFDRAKGPNDRKARWMTNFGNGAEDSLESRSLANNGELQAYVDPELQRLGLNPFRLTPQGLVISAARTPPQHQARLWKRPYTSGLISTRRSFSQLYGYFEIAARLPVGKGLWPAFWLMPADGSWPPELDVMEALGDDSWSYYATFHSKFSNLLGKHVRPFVNMSAGFHSYGVAWTAKEMIWYFDRREVARRGTPADMHKPMYMIANLAVGGRWPGAPTATVKFPANYEIGAIRVWRFKG